MQRKYFLDENWHFKVGKIHSELSKELTRKINKWLAAEVPGTVHTDLLKNKVIDDPFYSDNEQKIQWITDCNWLYKTKFNIPSDFNKLKSTFLVFDGVDTISEIYLNGALIGRTENMFLKYQFDVTNHLRKKNNNLIIKFTSPTIYSQNLEKKFGKLPVALNSSRVYIRKAQYSFGWDWGPSFPTSGLWRHVYLFQKSEASIEDVYFRTLKIESEKAIVRISFRVHGNSDNLIARINLRNQSFTYQNDLSVGDSKSIDHEILVDNPDLWFPNGFGNPNLYDLQITIFSSIDDILDQYNRKVGIRKIELILNEDERKTFHFSVNGCKIFARGFNWIPADSFLTRIDKSKYERLLNLAKNSGANIIRVWGGGIYENETFYETCDNLGLLVWQDFMFACGAYPEYEDFLKLVQLEINQNVTQLRNHACLAIFCGNNENEWIYYQNFRKPYSNMPGYKIFNQLIPELLSSLSPEIPYWESSPFGFEEDPNSFKSGNRHEWGIWSRWIDYTEVKHDGSLFVTEFGFQGPANRKTLENNLPQANRKIHDPIFEMHNKQIEGPERILRFLSAHLPVTSNWKNYFYLAQLNQGLALKTCVEHWRDNFPHTNGSIIWQLNDCWPVTSWSVIDSDLKLKMAYFFVKNIFSNNIISFREEANNVKVNVLNNSNEEFVGRIRIHRILADKGKAHVVINKKIKVDKNSKICCFTIPISDLQNQNQTVFTVSLYSNEKRLIFRNFYAPSKLKYLKFAQPKIQVKIFREGEEKALLLKTNKPVFFLDIQYPRFQFHDRGFILLPNETKKLQFEGKLPKNFHIKDLEIYHLNQFLS
ncbi:MAG: hypothetical protein HXY50_14285 [Ignavibacteriaceae bacterium]|nr:hypothetical protein [Ignavibacteriaceae bacterium]